MMGIEENSTICSDFVEFDPTRRYFRYNEILGKGASKIVYRAFDEYAGIEVAWNQVKLNDFIQSPDDLERIYSEIHLLDTLKHKNIMKFYTYWVDISKRNINFITELFTSGTLRQYRQKYRRVNIRAVKQWCQQILKGLLYLHSHDPPIIHRDLKCDNIFINGNQGVVKIGDLGLAAILRKSHADHIVGTPEFMAPEVYEEQYNELVDIYSFGMCVLEMVTLEYPYSECTNSAQIYKKVVKGIKPEALFKVEDPEVRQFVEKCLATASRRLPARELLRDPFLQIDDQDMDPWEGERLANDLLHEINMENGWDYSGLETSHILRQPLNSQVHSHDSLLTNRFAHDLPHEITGDGGWDYNGADFRMQGIDLFSNEGDEPLETVDIAINGMKREDGSIFLRLRVADEAGHVRNIYFPFDIDNDTALDVAAEMVGELDINGYGVTRIAEMIESEVSLLVSIDASSCGSLLDSVSIDTSGCTSLQSTLYSNGEFEETCQAEGSGNGAPVHSTSISEELDLSSDTSRDGHSDEGGGPFYGSTNNWKEIHVESKRETGVRECVEKLHSSSIENQSLETTKSRFQTKHQVGQKDERSLKLGGKTRNPSLASDHLESRAMNEAAVSLAHTSSKASSEKHRKSRHFGKFSFLNPPRRNLLQSSKSLAANDTGSHLSSGARRDQHCEASPKNSQENKFTAMKLYAGYRGYHLQSGLL